MAFPDPRAGGGGLCQLVCRQMVQALSHQRKPAGSLGTELGYFYPCSKKPYLILGSAVQRYAIIICGTILMLKSKGRLYTFAIIYDTDIG
jgi:hypothetical protein